MRLRSIAILAWVYVIIPQAAAFLGAPLPMGARMGAARRPTCPIQSPQAAATSIIGGCGDLSSVVLSGLKGLALKDKAFPTKREVEAVMPEGTWVRDDKISLAYAAGSITLSLAIFSLAAMFIPMTMAWLPAWAAYWYAAGTIWTGCWVIAHECGHGAFSDNKTLQDVVGYFLHTAFLVPYFSWQRSHAVHHAKTNHVFEGETHVPYTMESGKKTLAKRAALRRALGNSLGDMVYGSIRMVSHLVFGWPAYLLAGVTGGPVRGVTNHFIPVKPFATGNKNTELFPGAWKKKVWFSDVGIVAMIGLLTAWSIKYSVWHMLALYAGPLCVLNCWLVLYTWLQHTDTDVPHFAGSNWSYIKGAFTSIDRPYGAVFDLLHHHIGSTHVVHHIDGRIPHYRALAATKAVEKAFPEHYLYDPTPISQAIWRVSTQCIAVEERDNKWVFVQGTDGDTPEIPSRHIPIPNPVQGHWGHPTFSA